MIVFKIKKLFYFKKPTCFFCFASLCVCNELLSSRKLQKIKFWTFQAQPVSGLEKVQLGISMISNSVKHLRYIVIPTPQSQISPETPRERRCRRAERRCCRAKRQDHRFEWRVFECFMMFHNVLRVFHDVLLVVHNVLHVFHDVSQCFTSVLWCFTMFYDV